MVVYLRTKFATASSLGIKKISCRLLLLCNVHGICLVRSAASFSIRYHAMVEERYDALIFPRFLGSCHEEPYKNTTVLTICTAVP